MLNTHIEIMQLIVAYTCVGVFVTTAVAVILNLFNLITLESDIRKKLHATLLFEVVAISVALFSGIMKLNPAPVVQEIKTSQAKLSLSEAQQQATALIGRPSTKDNTDPPVESLNTPVSPQLKETLLKIEKIAPEIVPTAGWVFLGHVNAEKTMWTDKSAMTTTAQWPVKVGDTLTVNDDVYVRKITSDKWHSLAPVISVASVGERLQVIELQFNAARIGGFYVWAKASIKPG